MSTGALFKRFMKYALPSITSMIVFSLYTIVDGVIVSWGVGEEALAAVNLSAPFSAVVFSIGVLLASGTSVVTAISLGQGEEKRANRYFNQNLVITAAVALAITAFTLLNLEKVAVLLGAREHTLAYVKEYVGTVSVFAIFFMISYNLEVLVKTSGAPQLSVVGVVSSAITNTVLDMIFVFGFGWGVFGAAFATGLAQVVSTILFASYFLRKKGKLRFGKFRWEPGIYKRILPNGVADGITELSNGAVIFLYNQTILRIMGDDGIVSYTVISYVSTLILMMVSGTAQGLMPVSSYHYGKGEEQVSRRFYKLALLTGAVIGAAGFALCMLWGRGIVGVFLDRSSHLYDASVQALRVYCPVFLLMGFNVVSGAFFASLERPLFSSVISVGRGLAFPAMAVLIMPAILGTNGIWISVTISELVCFGVSLVFVYRYKAGVAAIRGKVRPENEKQVERRNEIC